MCVYYKVWFCKTDLLTGCLFTFVGFKQVTIDVFYPTKQSNI